MSSLCESCSHRFFTRGGRYCGIRPSLPLPARVDRCGAYRERRKHPHRFPKVREARDE